jgi:diguanylate cyclase (GGDEF)-like protein
MEIEIRKGIDTQINSNAGLDLCEMNECINVVYSNLDRLICGIVVIEPSTRTIVYANQVACDMMGRTQLEVKGQRCHKFICPAAEHECPILDIGKTVDNSEKKLVISENEMLPILKSVSKVVVSGKDYLLESFVIIQKQKNLEDELRKLSHIDHLTGLRNRVVLHELVQAEMSHAKRFQTPTSIVVYDLDNFKLINDNQGHLTGDRVLEEMSEFLIKSTREVDVIIRWGGDEFLLLLPDTNEQNAKHIAQKIAENIKNHDFKTTEALTASYGVSQYRLNETWEEWFERADEGLYNAKKKKV